MSCCYHCNSPVCRLKRTLTAVCSGRPTVRCKYLATTVFNANLTRFCSPQPDGSIKRLSSFGGEAISPNMYSMNKVSLSSARLLYQ